tara:strand:- start:6906 stop:7451 length:546 start_codon:yes stop_codon:yes gene_type:complete
MFLKRRSRRAADLVNSMFYLVVASTVMAGAALAFHESMERQKLQNAARQAVASTEALKSIFMLGMPSDPAAANGNLMTHFKASPLLPSDMLDGAGSLVHALGGNVRAEISSAGLKLFFEGLPLTACSNMALSVPDAKKVAMEFGAVRLEKDVRTQRHEIAEACLSVTGDQNAAMDLSWTLL